MKEEHTINTLGQSIEDLTSTVGELTNTVDTLAQAVAKGFSETNQRIDALTVEVFRLGDDIRDLKSITKSHQQMLMDHESRLEVLEA
jgi:uncharacterized protein YoxC